MADEERTGRRRRRRGRRGRGRGGAQAPEPEARVEPASQPQAERRPSLLPEWQWLTLPVVVAFALGVVATVFASGSSVAVLILFVGSLFAVGLGIARVVTRSILARRNDR